MGYDYAKFCIHFANIFSCVRRGLLSPRNNIFLLPVRSFSIHPCAWKASSFLASDCGCWHLSTNVNVKSTASAGDVPRASKSGGIKRASNCGGRVLCVPYAKLLVGPPYPANTASAAEYARTASRRGGSQQAWSNGMFLDFCLIAPKESKPQDECFPLHYW